MERSAEGRRRETGPVCKGKAHKDRSTSLAGVGMHKDPPTHPTTQPTTQPTNHLLCCHWNSHSPTTHLLCCGRVDEVAAVRRPVREHQCDQVQGLQKEVWEQKMKSVIRSRACRGKCGNKR